MRISPEEMESYRASLYIANATVLTPGTQIDGGAVLVAGPWIRAVGRADTIPCPAGAQSIDASGLYLAPGFIDLQINGAMGHDFTANPDSIWRVATALPRYGVTAFLPTIITSPPKTVAWGQKVLKTYRSDGGSARPLGLHVEGPFLNPSKKGAHNARHLRALDREDVRNWSPENGVRLVTLAPELPGALDLIRVLVEQGVVVGLGHSQATYRQALSAFEAGARYGTHLFNAMPPLDHREPGLTGAMLTDHRVVAGLIADGIHTHTVMISLAWRVLGPRRLNLVTDAVGALGTPPGRHRLGDQEVLVDGQTVRLPDGTLAGSMLSLDRGLRNLMAFAGCPLAEALPTVTSTPAALLGLGRERGCIAPNAIADLVLLTPEAQVHTTIVAGKVVYQEG